MRRLLGILVFEAALLAQVGPYPPGYPGGPGYPGQYPGTQGPGIPWPRKGKKSQDKNAQEALTTNTGILRKMDEKSIVLELKDARVLNYRRDAKTKFYKAQEDSDAGQFKPGDEVAVDSVEDNEGYLTARNVYLQKSAARSEVKREDKGEEKPEPSEPATVMAPPASAPDPEDPGPPTLKHGAKARRASPPKEEPAEQVASAKVPQVSPAVETADPYIDKARQAASAFTERLPDYVCKEFIARYYSSTRPVDWKPIDIVSSDLVYEKGQENYRNIAINGKPVNKAMDQLNGSWSTGEFASVLMDLFAFSTNAEFYFSRTDTVSGHGARVYDFTVEQPRSHWHVQVASQALNPAYKGSIWIDPKNGRVLRIEIQARHIPGGFPLDTVESAVDYDYIRIGEGQFLLPVHAELLSCQRDTSNCSRNSIDFRNYHKYSAESDIKY